MKRILGIVLFGLAVLAGCNKGSGGGAQMTTTAALDYKNGQALYAWVDALRVRAQPDPELASVANVNTGDKVTYLGETSANTATFELRGKEITGPFLKVKLADGTVGWVFAGGLQPNPPENAAKVLTVARSGADYTDLQKAIDNAQPGDTIRIVAGTYNFREPIQITGKKNIVIEGAGDSAPELINLNSYDNVFYLSRCENVTLRNLYVHHKEMATCYGAVVAMGDCENITVEDCELAGCGVNGVSIENSKNIKVIGNVIRDNSEGGVLMTGNYSDIVIKKNRFEYNYPQISVNYEAEIWGDSDLPARFKFFVTLSDNTYVNEEEGDYYEEEGEYYGD